MQRTISISLVAMVMVCSGLAPAAARPQVPKDWGWLVAGSDPVAVLDAVVSHPNKLPQDFARNLRYARPDGSLMVMVALSERTPKIERFVTKLVRELDWYGDDPRFSGAVLQNDFAALLRHPRITFVEPDYPLVYHLATSVVDVDARGAGGIWGFQPSVEPMGELYSSYEGLKVDSITGKDVTVAVVDSGIDRTHRDFGGWDCEAGLYQPCNSRITKAVVIDQVQGVPQDPGDEMPTTEIASGHGSHVAGIVAGNGYYTRDGGPNDFFGGDGYVIGMAPQASLISVKVGDGPSASLGSRALQWTLDHAEEYGIRVANNSWGCAGGCAFSPGSVLAQIQRDLYKANVLTVFSAGNSGDGSGVEGTGEQGTGAGLSGHSQSPYVLSAASYDDQTGRLSSFSSRGAPGVGLVDPGTWTPESEADLPPRRPDLAAPGSSIDSAASLTPGTWPIPRVEPQDAGQGSTSLFAYSPKSGTSMAAPHVSGAAALLIGACPQARTLHVMRALMAGSGASPILRTDGLGPADPRESGYGGLNVRASLDWLMSRAPCNGQLVNTAPLASFSAPDSASVGESMTFDASSTTDADGNISDYEWDFGDGSDAGEGEVVQHAYSKEGLYEVSLSVRDAGGLSSTVSKLVRVRADLGSIGGSVRSKHRALEGAKVNCGAAGKASTDRSGSYVLEGIERGIYTCTARLKGYGARSRRVTVEGAERSKADFLLKKQR